MSEKETYLNFNEETGTWELLPEPYALITVDTKSDFEYIRKAILSYSKAHPDVKITFRVEIWGEKL